MQAVHLQLEAQRMNTAAEEFGGTLRERWGKEEAVQSGPFSIEQKGTELWVSAGRVSVLLGEPVRNGRRRYAVSKCAFPERKSFLERLPNFFQVDKYRRPA